MFPDLPDELIIREVCQCSWCSAEISERPFEQLSGNSAVAVMDLGSPRDPMQDDISEGKGECFTYHWTSNT